MAGRGRCGQCHRVLRQYVIFVGYVTVGTAKLVAKVVLPTPGEMVTWYPHFWIRHGVIKVVPALRRDDPARSQASKGPLGRAPISANFLTGRSAPSLPG